jgi:glycosyltransferase involved in cell wall biosynthesis
MKIIYFSLEDIDSGLFESQVLNMVVDIQRQNPEIQITLLVINQPWKAYKAKKKINRIRSQGIEMIYLPFLPPLRWVSSAPFFSFLYILYLWLLLKLFVDLKQYKLVHCRNYLPALVIRNFRNINFLFDVRSLHAYEYVQANKIKVNSDNYNYWLENEKKLLLSAVAVTVVSKGMISYLQSMINRPIDYCPIISNYDLVSYDQVARNEIRAMLGWEKFNIYVYSGSFGLYGLNKTYLARLIKFILERDANARFLFLTSNSAAELALFLKDNRIDENLVFGKSVKLAQLTAFLSAADIGIHALPNQLDSFTRLGTKVVEYWSAGLPVIINNHIGEAVAICEQLQLGKVISLETEGISVFDMNLEELLAMDRMRIRALTSELFSSAVVAKSYANIYARI